MLKTITAGLLALLAWTMTPAHAADITYNAKCNNGSDSCHHIFIDGDIVQGDAKKFADVIASAANRTDRVFLNSPGGVFEDGMAIAKRVHQSNFVTYVDNGDLCTSMCAIIWLAGNTRYYYGKSKIGFHGVYSVPVDKQGNKVKGGKATPWNGGNALIGAFYNQLGLSDKAIEALTEAAPADMFWLNTKNLNELSIIAQRLEING
jgi:hypothetical protein